ncbi:sugar phosphate nucleotidyltransferase [Pseudotabrizicola algicola]|uniref:NTP transferase domain-containing protein n=1 Tax=Pseudotabrizicola algicola TaxID=2709381 RepID=A0A6B3RMC3_9RHOB|nr:sugar phosphate nucleotidyltransferase [Pseudotabrizicola algicola]NEX47200.1 NTP transferase domain-containing protein [Pseudotabrizicola algicola]
MADQVSEITHEDAGKAPVAILLAGGRGSRLYELTDRTCKPALPFVRRRRIVDFTMQNIVQSGLQNVVVASQYRPESLEAHLAVAWSGRLAPGGLMVRRGSEQVAALSYGGTADAVWKNVEQIDALAPREVLILSADHVYQMDYRPLIAAHRRAGAQVTLAAKVVDRYEARGFGVITANAAGKITDFVEKPDVPPTLPGDPDHALASMGIYVCDWAWLRRMLAEDAALAGSSHDFGHDILPRAVRAGQAFAWNWEAAEGHEVFWRDVGTLDALRETWLQFESDTPCALPAPDLGPFAVEAAPALSRFGMSTAVGGVKLFAPLRNRNGQPSWGMMEQSVLMDGARLSPGCRLTKALIAPGVTLPEGLVVGEDPDEDRRWFRVTPGGTTLVTTQMLSRRALRKPRASRGFGALFQQVVS